jgi:hypothetical protein
LGQDVSGEIFMRVWTFPLAAALVLAGSYSAEPTEQQMQNAFRISLQEQVSGVLEFVAETGDPEALARIYEAGTDRFALRNFRKFDCMRSQERGYRCDFAVAIDVVNGTLQRHVSGTFYRGPDGLIFISDI